MSVGTKLAKLIAAAEAYGDAKVAQEACFKIWQPGDPAPPPFDRDLEYGLHSAARAYATATRRSRTTPIKGAASDV